MHLNEFLLLPMPFFGEITARVEILRKLLLKSVRYHVKSFRVCLSAFVLLYDQ